MATYDRRAVAAEVAKGVGCLGVLMTCAGIVVVGWALYATPSPWPMALWGGLAFVLGVPLAAGGERIESAVAASRSLQILGPITLGALLMCGSVALSLLVWRHDWAEDERRALIRHEAQVRAQEYRSYVVRGGQRYEVGVERNHPILWYGFSLLGLIAGAWSVRYGLGLVRREPE